MDSTPSMLLRKAPNLAATLFLAPVFVGVVVTGLSGGGLVPGALASVVVAGLGGAACAAIIAARLARAPLLVTAITAAAWALGKVAIAVARAGIEEGPPGPSPMLTFGILGVIAAWIRAEVYVRSFDPARLGAWVGEGLRGLVRDEPSAPATALTGLGMAVLAMVLLFWPLASRGDPSTTLLWIGRGAAVAAIGLLGRSLWIHDAEVPESD